MSALSIIAKREFRSYFHSPIAFVILTLFLVACAVVTFVLFGGVFLDGTASMRRFFMAAPFISMFVCPAIAMRLIAEERKTRSIESVMTLPIRSWQIIGGKFIGAFLLMAFGFAFTLAFPLSIAAITADGVGLDWGPVLGGYLGLLLLSAAFLAIGLYMSALTKDQVVAFILGVSVCVLFVFVDWAAFVVPDSIAEVVNYLSADLHFDSIARGVIDSRDIVYFLSLTGVFLFLSVRALEGARQ